MSELSELRRDQRDQRIEHLHIQVLWGAEQEDLPGLVLHVATRDVSRTGFCASANHPLSVGRIFDVLLEMSADSSPYLLTAEVRWCKQDDTGGYAVGFIILNALHSDIEVWQKRF